MSVIATDTTRFSAVVKFEFEPSQGMCRDTVVLNDAAATLAVGAVLGKVTATGKYKLVEADAVDGSEVAAAVLIADSMGYSRSIALAADTDTTVLVLVKGPAKVAASALTFGASVNLDAEKLTQYAALEALGILVETAA